GGDQLWVSRFNGPTNDDDNGRSVAVSPDGTRVFVTGWSYHGGNADYVTSAYDSGTGSALWTRRYNGPANSGDSAYSVAVSPDGARVFVTGASYGPGYVSDYATVAYDAATGGGLWMRRYAGSEGGDDVAEKVVASPDGTRVFVTGSTYSSGPYLDY